MRSPGCRGSCFALPLALLLWLLIFGAMRAATCIWSPDKGHPIPVSVRCFADQPPWKWERRGLPPYDYRYWTDPGNQTGISR